jgi:hypothetical protein
MVKRAFLVITVSVLVGALTAGDAAAQVATSVSLSASAATLTYGEEETLSGNVVPPAAGETVELRDQDEALLGTTTTDGEGAFSYTFGPERSLDAHATWRGTASVPVHVDVRAKTTVRLGKVLLFASASVSGKVSPPRAGARVVVTLSHGGQTVATRHPVIQDDGTYATTLPIDDPGAYRAHASFQAVDLLQGKALDGPERTPLPSLHAGSTGGPVKLLEQRLVELHYRLVGVNRSYDLRTGDAVLAFRKVQGMSRVSTVDPSVWRALADPKLPRPRVDARRFHIEVDQTHQVLYTVDRGEITNILHISTGKPSTPTHDGSFLVYRKFGGLTSGGLYYPSYFDGLRALHGYVEVPTYPASHGCVRIPYWNAQWVYRHAPIGTRVIVYH